MIVKYNKNHHVIEEHAYKPNLQDVAHPNLHRKIFTYGEIPKIAFISAMNMPALSAPFKVSGSIAARETADTRITAMLPAFIFTNHFRRMPVAYLRAFSYCPCMKNVNEKLDATAAAMKKLLPAQDILLPYSSGRKRPAAS